MVRFRPLALVLASALALVPALGATSYVLVDDATLVADATLAVVGSVRTSEPAADGGVAVDYLVAVERRLKGEAPATVRVRIAGGERDGVGLRIWGAPRFASGERVLLFLDAVAPGVHRPTHFLLGAFHEVAVAGERLALRRLGGARALRVAGQPAVDDRPRDFERFADWVAARSSGRMSAAVDYRVAAADVRVLAEGFTLFEDSEDGFNLRWFNFDDGGNVSFRAHQSGQQGVAGGGFAEVQTALAAWTADAATPVDYRYGGKTSSTNGLATYDELNTILFNDPTGIMSPFNCSVGGVLAVGGPWYAVATDERFGFPYHPIVNADIVTAKNIGCFFTSSPNPSRAAQELFAHELGHTLGIGHACGDERSGDPQCLVAAHDDALMRAFIHDDGRGAALRADDREALGSLYGSGPKVVPTAPAGLEAAPTGADRVELTWLDVPGETGYRLYRKVGGEPWTLLASIDANVTLVEVVHPAGAPALYRLTAINPIGESAPSNVVAIATAATPGATCTAGPTTLCVGGGRFRVEAWWETPDQLIGKAGVAAPPGVDDSGNLWFFSADNLELLVKVLDGCPVNQRYWVFWAATTNVEVLLSVTDTATGAVKVYANPLGTPAAPVQDVEAFASCG